MSPQDKARHKEIQRADSRRVTANQVIAETGNFVMGATAAAGGDPSVSARVLATQVRNIIYAAMRELMQASLKFVDTRGPGTSGVNNANMSSMAAVYTLMTMGASTASDAVVGAVLNARSVSLSGLQFQVADTNNPVNDPQLENAALVALVRGLFNTAVEAIDAGVGKHYETKQVGARQVWNSGSKLPMKDHDRILDHSVARFSWNQLAGMANLAVQQAARATGLDKAAPALTSFLGVGTTAAAFGLAYRNTNQTYQAHARVRSAVASAQAPAAPATAPAPDGSSQATASGTGHTTQARQRHAAAQEIEESTDDDASRTAARRAGPAHGLIWHRAGTMPPCYAARHHVQSHASGRAPLFLRGACQGPGRPADGSHRNPGQPVDRGTPRIPRRALQRGRGPRARLRPHARPHQPLPAPVHAPLDQRAVQHRPAARHPPGGGTARRPPGIAAGCAPCRHGMPGHHALGEPALGAPPDGDAYVACVQRRATRD